MSSIISGGQFFENEFRFRECSLQFWERTTSYDEDVRWWLEGHEGAGVGTEPELVSGRGVGSVGDPAGQWGEADGGTARGRVCGGGGTTEQVKQMARKLFWDDDAVGGQFFQRSKAFSGGS